MSTFGRTTDFINRTEYSQALLQFAASRLRSANQEVRITQSALATELGVTQPLVHSVLHGRKSFGPSTLARYAEKLGKTRAQLATELLRARRESQQNDLDTLRDADGPESVLLSAFAKTSDAIEIDRMHSLHDFDSTFDSERAYYEVLACVRGMLGRLGLGLVGGAILYTSDDSAHAVSFVHNREIGDFLPIRHRIKTIPSWLRSEIGRVFAVLPCDNATNIVFLDQCSETQKQELADQEWLVGEDVDSDEISIVGIRRIFNESHGVQRSGAIQHALLLAMRVSHLDDVKTNYLDQVLFLGSKLGERIALYSLEDRLRMAEIMLDEGILDDSSLSDSSDICNEQEGEMTATFLNNLWEAVDRPDDVSAIDIWRLSLNTRTFYSPSPQFRMVGPSYRDEERRAPDGTRVSFGDLYEKFFDELQPRAYGRTSYMVANKKAIVLQPFADETKNSYWNSAPFLGFSTFIGVPFVFKWTDWTTRLHISVLYIRCARNVSAENAKGIVLAVCQLMQAEHYWRHFTPLVAPDAAWQVRSGAARLELTENAIKSRTIEPRCEQDSVPIKWTEMWFQKSLENSH